MSLRQVLLYSMLLPALALAACDDADDTPSSTDPPPATVDLDTPFEAITVLTFDASGTLYLADSGTGKLYALNATAGTNASAGQPFNLRDVDQTLAELLGTSRHAIRVRDMAVHPTTTEAYIAVAVPDGDTLQSVVVVIDQSGAARLLDTTGATDVQLPFAPTAEFSFYDAFPSRDLSVTDLTVHDGILYVAGMSNADFTSTLWTVPVPFDGEPRVTTVEIYHGVHAQLETRAPIRTMTIAEINGEPMVLAAYTCTPLVAFPVSEVQDGAHITGKTIAELGFGNTPGDVLAFDGQDMMGNPIPMLFVQNKNQSAQVLPMAVIADAVAAPGIESPLGLTPVTLGATAVPMTGILQIDEQDPGRLLAVRRDAESGALELVSYLKNVYFRLSDFQSEYEVPSYSYPPEQEQTKQFQNMMKMDEGKAEFVVE